MLAAISKRLRRSENIVSNNADRIYGDVMPRLEATVSAQLESAKTICELGCRPPWEMEGGRLCNRCYDTLIDTFPRLNGKLDGTAESCLTERGDADALP